MKKIIILIINMVLFPFQSFSQGFYQTKYGSIDSIHLRAEVYFDSIRANFGDSALSAEGSEYNYYMRWRQYVLGRIGDSGSYYDLFLMQKAYFDSLKNQNISIKQVDGGLFYLETQANTDGAMR